MEIIADRAWKKPTYTISRIIINGERFLGEFLEDTDRGLKQSDSIDHIKAVKKPGVTAIPSGRYEIDLDTVSPKYVKNAWYKMVCAGKVPRLKEVPGFQGSLIHTGNTASDSEGCLIIGRNLTKGKVLQSRTTFCELYALMRKAKEAGEHIWITIH